MNDQARTREEKNRINSVSDRRQRFIRTKILPLLHDINNEQHAARSKFYSMCIDCYLITEKLFLLTCLSFFLNALIFCTEFTKLLYLKDVVQDYDTTRIYWSKRKREFKQAHPKVHQQIESLQAELKHFLSGLSILDSIKSTSSKVLIRKIEAVVAMCASKTGSDQFISIRKTELLGRKSHTAAKYFGGATATSDHNQSQQMDGLLAIALASPGPTANASANAAGVERAPKSPVASKLVGTPKKPPPPPSASANAAGVGVGGNGPPNSPSPITIIVEYQGKKHEMGIAVPRERHNSWELMTKATNKIILSTTTKEFMLSSQWVSFDVVINPELRKYVEWTVKNKMSSYGTFTMDHKGNNNADFVFMIPSKQDCISQKMVCRIAPLLSIQNFVVDQISSVNSTTSSEKCSGPAADHFKNSSGPMGSSLRITTRPLAKSSPNPAKRQRAGSLFKKGQPFNLAGFVTSSGGIPKVLKISFDQNVGDVVEGDQRKTRKPVVKYDQTLLLENKIADADENSTLVDMLNQERKENENNSKKNRALVEILSNTPKRNDRTNLRPRTSFP